MSVGATVFALLVVCPAYAADFRNALVVVADDLGVDKVGAYAADVSNTGENRPSTPMIDLLATAGVRFTDAWAMPMCSPARATLLSGEYPYRSGIGDVLVETSDARLPVDPISLQQLAADAGMRTALFGKWHLGHTELTPQTVTPGFDHAEFAVVTGFEDFRGAIFGQTPSYLDWLYVRSIADATRSSGYTTSAQQLTTSVTSRTTEDAVAWMQARSEAGERHFTVVSYHLPHDTPIGGDARNGWSWSDAVTACGGEPVGEDVADHRTTVECLDHVLEGLFTRTPDLDDTLVVFLGDNGSEPQTGEGNFDDGRGKGTPFESGVRVPLVFVDGEALRHTIARGEPRTDVEYRYTPGAVVGEPSSIVDLYATLVDVLALDPGTCTPGVDCARDSRSMREVLDGGLPARDAVWAERFLAMGGGVVGDGAVRIGDTKLYVHTAAAEPCRRYLMYDLATDRWERTNLFFTPERLDEKRALLAELELHAAAMAGTANDWLAYDACCEAKDAWYDGVDSNCDGADDYDQDGDGSAFSFDGGGDCDDVDPAVHPGAVDAPGDGVDADCDGYDGPPPDDTAGDTASDTDPPADTDTDGGDPDDPPCGCATTPGAGAAVALGAVFALRRRRR